MRAPQPRDESHADPFEKAIMDIDALTVEGFMTTAVMGVRPSSSIGQCREIMDLTLVRHVPVVNDHNHVIGMISNHDLHRATQTGCGSIADIPLRAVCTVRSTTPVLDAIERMTEQGLGSLAVIGPDKQLVGMITETDVLAIARHALLNCSSNENHETSLQLTRPDKDSRASASYKSSSRTSTQL